MLPADGININIIIQAGLPMLPADGININIIIQTGLPADGFNASPAFQSSPTFQAFQFATK